MKRHILMLEHDDDDRYIAQSVIDELNSDVRISFVSTSTEFFQKLEAPKKPDLLLITLRSSPLNAIEILRKIKDSAALRHIPVLILSGISNSSVVRECYEAGASSFITKPSSEKDTTGKISAFLEYWFKTVELP
jgi:CheY-like chemotaxis protein